MPAYSTLRTFIDALKTGRTNITRALDGIMSNPGQYTSDPHYDWLQQPNALNQPMPGWLRQRLRAKNVTEPEIDHMDRWPDAQKEVLRQAMVDSIANNRPMRFRWILHDGEEPRNDIEYATNVVTFKSPGAGVRLSNFNLGAVHVDA